MVMAEAMACGTPVITWPNAQSRLFDSRRRREHITERDEST
jgi:hypothetical protein